jgi:ABC-type sugar transport system ATPase subunit
VDKAEEKGDLPMNFFRGIVRGGAFLGDGFSIPHAKGAEHLKDGRSVVVGIRPEDVGITADGIEARVERWEPVYEEKAQILHTSFGNVRCVAKVYIPRRISPKDHVGLHFDPTALVFLDPDSGERIG